MAYTVEEYQGEPIILVKVMPPYTPEMLEESPREIMALVHDFYERVGGPIYRINDLRDSGLSLSELMISMAEERAGAAGSVTDTNVRNLVVANEGLVKQMVEAMSQPQYSGIHMPIFETVEEALAHIRAELVSLQNS